MKLSEPDRPSGIQAEVLRSVQNMVVLMDEQFLVHSAVHKAVLRLLRSCVGDDIQEQLDGRHRAMGAAGSVTKSQPSEYEEDCTFFSTIVNPVNDAHFSGKSSMHIVQSNKKLSRTSYDFLP